MNKNLNSGALRRKLLSSVGPSAGKSAAIMGAGIAGLLAVSAPAHALNLYDGSQYGNNVEVNLNTTLSYTGFYRVNDPSAVLEGPTNANGNDGDSNFQHGIVGNQFEALPVFDIRAGNFGFHASGELYINTPYLGTNQNDQPGTVNPFSIAKNTDFTSATRNINGENARLLDLFAFGKHTFANDQSVSLKVGQQTLLWGQSLFFAGNGIAAGQAPIDVVTAEDLANPQSQQVFLPVGQAVLTYQPARGINIQGYYQYQWAPDNLQGVGSYFSSTDLLDKGGQRLIAGNIPGVGNLYAFRIKDIRPPKNDGQFGLSAQATLGEWDLGLYGLRFNSKTPDLYVRPAAAGVVPTANGLSIGNYQLVYARNIAIYGTSFSTNLGAANVAGEVSGRTNMPLISGALEALPGELANASSAPLYAVGDTWAAQSSAIYVTSSLPGDPGGVSISGEVEFNHVISVTRNRDALAPGRQASAAAFDISMTPTYYDVLPNFVVTFPIGITYNFLGRSEIDPSMQHGVGNFTFGVTGTYEANWIAGLTYKDYLGKVDTVYNADADRGYLSLNLQHTF